MDVAVILYASNNTIGKVVSAVTGETIDIPQPIEENLKFMIKKGTLRLATLEEQRDWGRAFLTQTLNY